MSKKEIDSLFSRGMEQMRQGNYREAESLFQKAKDITLDRIKK